MIASGVAASLHVGKVPPALPALRDELGLGLVPAGWVASIFNLMGATLGVASGLVADRIGARRVLAAGLVFLIAGSILGRHRRFGRRPARDPCDRGPSACSPSPSPPPGSSSPPRPPRDHGLALGAWSIYLPTGMAIGMLSAPFVLPGFGWRGLWLLHAGAGAAVLLIVLAATRGISAPPECPARRVGTEGVAPPWPVAARRRVRLLHDPVLRGGDLAADVPRGIARQHARGSGACRRARRRRQRHRQPRRRMAASPQGPPAGSCSPPPTSSWPHARPESSRRSFHPEIKIALAVVFSAVGGLLPAAILGAASAHAPSRDHVATVNGFIVQGSHAGVVAGPTGLCDARRFPRRLGPGLDPRHRLRPRRPRRDGSVARGGTASEVSNLAREPVARGLDRERVSRGHSPRPPEPRGGPGSRPRATSPRLRTRCRRCSSDAGSIRAPRSRARAGGRGSLRPGPRWRDRTRVARPCSSSGSGTSTAGLKLASKRPSRTSTEIGPTPTPEGRSSIGLRNQPRHSRPPTTKPGV